MPRRDEEWHLEALHIPEAHALTTGFGVIIGLVDSGVDVTNPDLAGQVLPGASARAAPATVTPT